MQPQIITLALPVNGFRRGWLGDLPVDADYLRRVKARARLLAKAFRVNGDDVIVKRWQEYTGKTATLESTGEPFPG